MTVGRAMLIQINYKSGKPVYVQVVDQVKAASASGALKPGEALPCIRPLAEELRVNRNTIAKAYSELENVGVIETIPGKGCFLKQNNSPLRKDVRRLPDKTWDWIARLRTAAPATVRCSRECVRPGSDRATLRQSDGRHGPGWSRAVA